MRNCYQAGAALLALLAGCSTNSTTAPSPMVEGVGQPTAQQAQAAVVVEQNPLPTQQDAGELYELGMAAKAAGDYQAMLDNLMAAADTGNPQAHYELARLLSEGKLVVRDPQAAKLYLERSAQLGNPEALRVLAWNTLRGDGMTPDRKRGESMMRKAAESSLRAQRELGMLYANIYKPHLNDYDQANHYLTLAAEAGDADAAYQLGRVKEGSGDAIGAVEWYEKASSAGQGKARAALKALESGEPATAPLVAPSARSAQAQPEVDAEHLYLRAMQLLAASSRPSQEQEADAYAMLVLASERGYQQATQELSFQGGVKQQLDQQNPNWLDQAKLRVLRKR